MRYVGKELQLGMIQFFRFRLFHFPQAQFVAQQHPVFRHPIEKERNAQSQDYIDQVSPPGSPERGEYDNSQFPDISAPHSVFIRCLQLESICSARQIIIISKTAVCIRILPVTVKIHKTIGISVQFRILISESSKFDAEIIVFRRQLYLVGVCRHNRRNFLPQTGRQTAKRMIINFDVCYLEISFLR